MGVDGIKTEALLSKDDFVILRFLPFLIINGEKTRINELNLEDIKEIKLENNESIPTLNEMFEQCKDKIRYNFDIRNVETGKKIIDLALEYDLLENVELTRPVSYTKPFYTLLKPLREKNRDIILINSLYSDKQITHDHYTLLDQMKKIEIQVVNLNHHRFNLEVFKRVKKMGLKFYVWGVLFRYFMKKYLTLNYKGKGIDGIYTNYPDKLVQLRKLL
jgi:glycerophosphoryl diester phosphodiesterase